MTQVSIAVCTVSPVNHSPQQLNATHTTECRLFPRVQHCNARRTCKSPASSSAVPFFPRCAPTKKKNTTRTLCHCSFFVVSPSVYGVIRRGLVPAVPLGKLYSETQVYGLDSFLPKWWVERQTLCRSVHWLREREESINVRWCDQHCSRKQCTVLWRGRCFWLGLILFCVDVVLCCQPQLFLLWGKVGVRVA